MSGHFENGKLTACRHANGIDWWMFIKERETNRFFRYLITPENIEGPDEIYLGETTPNPTGQAVFSPDGTKYIRLQLVSIGGDIYVYVYDFDRCTGELSNPVTITYNDGANAGGVAVSPNSQYLYISSYNYVYQYDLWADEIGATKDTVAVNDGWHPEDLPDWWQARFFMMQLAPNGKIYISATNSVNVLHVINNPDLPGDSCDVCQHCVPLPSYNSFSMPNFPNYRLGESETLCIPDDVVDIEENNVDLKVAPNPATDQISVSWSGLQETVQSLTIASMLGQELMTLDNIKTVDHTVLDISHIKAGVYFVILQTDNGEKLSRKVIINR